MFYYVCKLKIKMDLIYHIKLAKIGIEECKSKISSKMDLYNVKRQLCKLILNTITVFNLVLIIGTRN